MSLALRHEPDVIGAELDKDGWLSIEVLLNGIRQKWPDFSFQNLLEVVETSDKKRFGLSDDQRLIRAVQGHSVELLGTTVAEAMPPPILFHGTGDKSVRAILEDGLRPMSRIHVHLSADIETAKRVGSRHGKSTVFEIDAKAASSDGVKFYFAENGVWLCDALPTRYLRQIWP